jgi:Fe-S cluster assembly protein SufB
MSTYGYVSERETVSTSRASQTTFDLAWWAPSRLFYLMQRGLPEDEAMAMIVRGFVEPIARELPMEYRAA